MFVNIIGTGGFAKEVADICVALGHEFCFVSKDWRGNYYNSFVKKELDLKSGDVYVIGIGNPRLRKEIAGRFETMQMTCVTLVHPSAIITNFATVNIGSGTIVCAGAILTSSVKIGRHCIINVGATLSHDCSIGDYVEISPGVHINGKVTIEDMAAVGSGTTTIPESIIGKGTIIGAGAVVKGILAENTVYVGSPVREIRKIE